MAHCLRRRRMRRVSCWCCLDSRELRLAPDQRNLCKTTHLSAMHLRELLSDASLQAEREPHLWKKARKGPSRKRLCRFRQSRRPAETGGTRSAPDQATRAGRRSWGCCRPPAATRRRCTAWLAGPCPSVGSRLQITVTVTYGSQSQSTPLLLSP
jgi:hypothetical protein